MTQERQATDGATATPAALRSRGSGAAAPVAPSARSKPLVWEEWYRHASPAQQAELLALASHQGVLYVEQMSPPALNGTAFPGPEQEGPLHLFQELLQGRAPDLPTASPGPMDWLDTGLDDFQRAVVSRALATPDVFLLQGLPGTGKSRVVTEIIAQAARQRRRVLLVACTSAGLDVVLERLAGLDWLFPVRLLHGREKIEDLPPRVREMTEGERSRAFRERSLEGALRNRLGAEERCQRRRSEEGVWPRLKALLEENRSLLHQQREIDDRNARIHQEVLHEAEACQEGGANPGAFAQRLAGWMRSKQDAQKAWEALRSRIQEQQREAQVLGEQLGMEIACLQPLVDAKNRGRWWALNWWKATLGSHIREKWAEKIAQEQAAQQVLQATEQQLRDLDQDRRRSEEEHRGAWQRIVDEETAGRQALVLLPQRTKIERTLEHVREQWSAVCQQLEHTTSRPGAMTQEAWEAGYQSWLGQRQRDEENCQFARQWAGFLQASAGDILGNLPVLANPLAVPLPHLAATILSEGQPEFDLVILEDAEQLAEADLERFAGLARRWILVADDTIGLQADGGALRLSQTKSCFQKLWHTLHTDPSFLPFAWAPEGDRLVCHLLPVPSERRRFLESEGLADHPEIELRILSLPRQQPQLAQVVFPGSMSLGQAKTFLYNELEELPIQVRGRSLWWEEQAAAIMAHFSPQHLTGTEKVNLEPGVSECVVGQGRNTGTTCRLEFDRSEGWDRTRAEAWVGRRLRLTDRGRTAYLQTPYRMQPALAAVVSNLLFGDQFFIPEAPAQCPPLEPAFEFVAVPTTRKGETARTCGPGRSDTALLPKQGAGLEIDLSAAKQVERLPAELRADLPRHGIVNFPEARAMIAKLEELVRGGAAGNGKGGSPSLTIIALYRSQAELIRRMIRGSPILSPVAGKLAVHVPEELRHRQSGTVLVSLTRSHLKVSPLGEGGDSLAWALSRAERKVIVLGDPGALVRRSQVQKPLDGQDEATFVRESHLIHQLVRYLAGHGQCSAAFRFHI